MKNITRFLLAILLALPLLMTAQNKQTKITTGAPVANFSAFVTNMCGGISYPESFTDLSTNNPTSWKWYFPGATPDTSTVKDPTNIVYSGFGCFTVKLVVKNSSGSDSLTDSNYICLEHPPYVAFTGSDSLCKGDSEIVTATGGESYHWSTGSTDSVITIKPALSMTYTIQVSNGMCFKDTTFTVIVYNCGLGIASISANPLLSVSPNPASSVLLLQMENIPTETSLLTINDITGRIVMQQKLYPLQMHFEMNISSLAPSLYFLKLQTSKGIVVKKFVKE